MKESRERIYFGMVRIGIWLRQYTECIYRQNMEIALNKSQMITSVAMQVIPEAIEEGLMTEQRMQEVFVPILEAQENEDYLLVADLYEMYLMPLVTEIQMTLVTELGNYWWKQSEPQLQKHFPAIYAMVHSKSGALPDNYMADYSNIGVPVLSVVKNGRRISLCSNVNPFREGEAFGEEYFHEDTDNYVVYGLGCGYHIRGLFMQNPDIKVKVFEPDENIIKYVAKNVWIKWVCCGRYENLEIIHDPDYTLLTKELADASEKKQLIIHRPSMQLIEQQTVREKIENYYVALSSIKAKGRMLNINFRKNMSREILYADDIMDDFAGKKAILIAGGPSLDEDMHRLRNIDRKKYIITCVGTVFKKLVNAGIIPDYVALSDPQPNMFRQFQDADTSGTRLLYLSTADCHAVEKYSGEKYMLLQEGYDRAEAVAAERGKKLFLTGGSVTTFLLDFLIRSKASSVICLGTDMAFVKGMTHALDTPDVKAAEGTRTVKDVYGKEIQTSKNLEMYRIWIENRIQGVKDTELINCAKGAYIHGMKHMTFEEALGL